MMTSIFSRSRQSDNMANRKDTTYTVRKRRARPTTSDIINANMSLLLMCVKSDKLNETRQNKQRNSSTSSLAETTISCSISWSYSVLLAARGGTSRDYDVTNTREATDAGERGGWFSSMCTGFRRRIKRRRSVRNRRSIGRSNNKSHVRSSGSSSRK